jgi:hypothetical protein
MRIRQIALVAEKLEPVAEPLRALFGLAEPFRDEGVSTFGLGNVVYSLGDTFLEVVSPVEAGTTAGRLLERRGGDGGYMVLLQTDGLAADRARLEGLGVRVVFEIALEDIAAVHLHPRDVGGAILSLDQPVPPGAWRWGGPGWQDVSENPLAPRIVGAQVQAADPGAMAARWSEVIGQPRSGACEIRLDGGTLHFVEDRDGRGDGVAGVTVAVRDPERVLATARSLDLPVEGESFRVCGTRFELARG